MENDMFLPNFIYQVDARFYQSRELEVQRYQADLKKRQEHSPLFEAVAQKNETMLCKYLKKKDAIDLNTLQKILFQFAESKEHEPIIKTLLSNCPPSLINARDGVGKTLLYQSVERGQESLTRLLINQGADSSIGDLTGLKPLDVLMQKEELSKKTKDNLISILVNPIQVKSNKAAILFRQKPVLVDKCNFAFDSVMKSIFFSHASTPKGRQIISKVIEKSLSSKKIGEIVEKYREKHKRRCNL